MAKAVVYPLKPFANALCRTGVVFVRSAFCLCRPVEEDLETKSAAEEEDDGKEGGPSRHLARARGAGARVLRAIPFQQLKILIGKRARATAYVCVTGSPSFCSRALT